MSRRRVAQLAVVGALAAGVSLLTASPSYAGIYTWRHYATYSTAAECQQQGTQLVGSGAADAYTCRGTSGNDLWLGYTW